MDEEIIPVYSFDFSSEEDEEKSFSIFQHNDMDWIYCTHCSAIIPETEKFCHDDVCNESLLLNPRWGYLMVVRNKINGTPEIVTN